MVPAALLAYIVRMTDAQTANAAAQIDAIRDDFSVLDDWEDRYRYVIELGGKTLAPLPDDAHTDANKVRGCASQVWLLRDVDRGRFRRRA